MLFIHHPRISIRNASYFFFSKIPTDRYRDLIVNAFDHFTTCGNRYDANTLLSYHFANADWNPTYFFFDNPLADLCGHFDIGNYLFVGCFWYVNGDLPSLPDLFRDSFGFGLFNPNETWYLIAFFSIGRVNAPSPGRPFEQAKLQTPRLFHLLRHKFSLVDIGSFHACNRLMRDLWNLFFNRARHTSLYLYFLFLALCFHHGATYGIAFFALLCFNHLPNNIVTTVRDLCLPYRFNGYTADFAINGLRFRSGDRVVACPHFCFPDRLIGRDPMFFKNNIVLYATCVDLLLLVNNFARSLAWSGAEVIHFTKENLNLALIRRGRKWR